MSPRRADGEPCPYYSWTGGCEFGHDDCAPGMRACHKHERWEHEQSMDEDDGGTPDDRDAAADFDAEGRYVGG